MTTNFKKLLAAHLILAATTLGAFAQGVQAPVIATTQGGGATVGIGTSLKNIVIGFKDISTGVYSSLFVVALILFFVGMMGYLLPGKSAEDKKKGLTQIGFGIVVIFVMVGIWGLVSFLSTNLGIGVGGGVLTPSVPYTTGL